MGFLSKLRGVDKGIDIFARHLLDAITLFRPAIEERGILLKLLNESSIPYRTNNIEKGTIHWNLSVKPDSASFMMSEDNNMITIDFSSMQNSLFEPITIIVDKDKVVFTLHSQYSRNRENLSNECQVLINSLTKYGVKDGYEF